MRNPAPLDRHVLSHAQRLEVMDWRRRNFEARADKRREELRIQAALKSWRGRRRELRAEYTQRLKSIGTKAALATRLRVSQAHIRHLLYKTRDYS
jgi:hypothetical protein